mmetsp:Transcript_31087/g.97571  ORF Transcript_31087/g.97571 Transcript_31087/m.97571 type:complete len:187 (-) Transcript_31087:211-771(-)
MDQLERQLRAPAARPGDIAKALAGSGSGNGTLPAALLNRLEDVAAHHGGAVPLHGRLFAQWLHYVFPRECPFPHRRGTTVSATPMEFGSEYLATGDEMQRHAKTANQSAPLEVVQEAKQQWLSQWSAEEELLVEGVDLEAPWEGGRRIFLGGALALFAVLAGLTGLSRTGSGEPLLLPTHAKSHFV